MIKFLKITSFLIPLIISCSVDHKKDNINSKNLNTVENKSNTEVNQDFTFKILKSKNKNLEYAIKFPVFTDIKIYKLLNDSIKSYINSFIREPENDIQFANLDIEMDLKLITPKLISIIISGEYSDDKIVRPNKWISVLNFNILNQIFIKYENVILPNQLSKLDEIIHSKISNISCLKDNINKGFISGIAFSKDSIIVVLDKEKIDYMCEKSEITLPKRETYNFLSKDIHNLY